MSCFNHVMLLISILCPVLLMSQSNSDEELLLIYKSDYNDGVFMSKDDFISGKITKDASLMAKGVSGLKKAELDTLEHFCWFFQKKSGKEKKLKNVFAVSYEGQLFIQIKSILKNGNKKDKSQISQNPQAFVRVIMGGDRFLFTEAELSNRWGRAFASNLGLLGVAMKYDMIHGKGVVWDKSKKEFNIFKNCVDFNKFLEEETTANTVECKDHQPDGYEVRDIVKGIK